MIAAIIVLQVIDILTTYYLVGKNGFKEANPVVNWLMDKVGFWFALVGLKSIFIALVLTVPVPYVFEVVILVLYLAVVGNKLKLVYNKKVS